LKTVSQQQTQQQQAQQQPVDGSSCYKCDQYCSTIIFYFYNKHDTLQICLTTFILSIHFIIEMTYSLTTHQLIKFGGCLLFSLFMTLFFIFFRTVFIILRSPSLLYVFCIFHCFFQNEGREERNNGKYKKHIYYLCPVL
jgi:hypothetical protein